MAIAMERKAVAFAQQLFLSFRETNCFVLIDGPKNAEHSHREKRPYTALERKEFL